MLRKISLIFFWVPFALLCGCGSDSGQAALRQGMSAFNEKNYSSAITLLTRAARRISDSADLYYHLGSAHLAKGEMEPAETALYAALELKPDYGEALAGLGQIAYYQKDIPKAKTLFEKALDAKLSSDEATACTLNGLALSEADQQNNGLARLHLLRAQKACRTYAPTFYNLASLYRDAFNLREEALDHFELYLRLADKNSRYYEKAENNIKRLQLNIERTQSEKLDSMRRDPSAAARLLHEGINAQSSRQYARAAKAYRDALTADPLAFNAAWGLGTVSRQQGQRAEALESFKRAADINPGHHDSHRQAAELAIQLTRYDEAEKVLDRMFARSPFTPFSAEMMARIRHAQNRFPEARVYGEFYLSLIPPDDKRRPAYQQWVNTLPSK
ncbi:MAG: tetratricopeptide repeat protein [Kiritimatiellae bacterium]|nr:tetratricopeptide repeat protein [Kiritimatiellia bacterium]